MTSDQDNKSRALTGIEITKSTTETSPTPAALVAMEDIQALAKTDLKASAHAAYAYLNADTYDLLRVDVWRLAAPHWLMCLDTLSNTDIAAAVDVARPAVQNAPDSITFNKVKGDVGFLEDNDFAAFQFAKMGMHLRGDMQRLHFHILRKSILERLGQAAVKKIIELKDILGPQNPKAITDALLDVSTYAATNLDFPLQGTALHGVLRYAGDYATNDPESALTATSTGFKHAVFLHTADRLLLQEQFDTKFGEQIDNYVPQNVLAAVNFALQTGKDNPQNKLGATGYSRALKHLDLLAANDVAAAMNVAFDVASYAPSDFNLTPSGVSAMLKHVDALYAIDNEAALEAAQNAADYAAFSSEQKREAQNKLGDLRRAKKAASPAKPSLLSRLNFLRPKGNS